MDGQPGGERASSGPAEAATPRRLVDEHWTAVFRLLLQLTNHRQDAEDLTQETFLRAIGRLGSFTPGTNARAWLMRIATNAFLDQKRRKKAGPLSGAEEEKRDPSQDAAAASVEVRELVPLVTAAVAQLPELERVVFVLRVESELPFSEIARVIGKTESAARGYMLQARRALLGALEGRI